MIRHQLSRFFRLINTLNPTTYGRSFITAITERYNIQPDLGVYSISNDIKMFLDATEYIDRTIYYNTFEVLSLQTIKKYLKPGDTFVDIGANIGYYSLAAKKQVGDNGSVIAFEPNPFIASKFKQNVQLNPNLQINLSEIAISNHQGEVNLYIPPYSSVGEASIKNQGWMNSVSVPVETSRLDDILMPEIYRIDCMKIDVEGAELLVIEGATECIKKFRPALHIEINPKTSKAFGYDSIEPIKKILEIHKGYDIYQITPHKVHRISWSQVAKLAYKTSSNLWLVPH